MWMPFRTPRAKRPCPALRVRMPVAAELLEARCLLSGAVQEDWATPLPAGQVATVPFEPSVWPNAIFGTDDRTRVMNTGAFPFSAIARVNVRFSNGYAHWGSGALISPFHILTAGHVVHDRSHGGWGSEIKVALARDGAMHPFGPEANVVHYRSYTQWTTSSDVNHDWALLTLDRSLGDYAGYLGYEALPTASYAGMAAQTAGYPSDRDSGTRMYTASGPLSGASETQLQYTGTMDTYRGQSGSPVWRMVDGAPVVNGIHAYGYATYNAATRITAEKFASLQAWIGEDMAQRAPVDRADLLDFDAWFATSHSSFSPGTALRGGPVQISARIANLGTAAANGYTLSFYASTDATITAADHLIGAVTLSTAAMSHTQLDWSGALPANIPTGQYHIGWIIDAGNVISEFREDNNTGVISGGRLAVNAAEPDRFEPNDTFATARNLGVFTARSEPGLTLHASGDADYFRFIPAAAGQLTATILFQHAQGNLNLELFDANYVLLAESRTTWNIETVSAAVSAGQVYHVRITGANGATSPGYDLSFAMSYAPDAREPNNAFAQASDLGTLTHITVGGVSIHQAGDEDFFRFRAGTTGPMVLAIHFLHDEGDLDLRLYGAQQNHLAMSAGATDGEQIVHHVVAGQLYYVRVSGAGGATNPGYSLNIATTQQIPADRFEPNDTMETAVDLGSILWRSEPGLTVHDGTDRDYFRFSPAVGGMLRIDVSFAHAFGDIDLYLYSAAGQELAVSLSETDQERIELEVAAGEVYYLLVEACGGTSPEYNLSIAVAAATGEIRGRKFLDRNANGIQDPGEPPLEGWTVFLDENRNGLLDPGERFTITNAQGEYAFLYLVEGTYSVGAVPREGWIQIEPEGRSLSFDIDLRFVDDNLTSGQRAIFQQAAARWSQIIIADLPDVLTTQGLVDDLLIDIVVRPIDGPGQVLGQAGPRELRNGSGLPAYGMIEFDLADLEMLEASGQLLAVVLHEMGHVLGFGTIWESRGLIIAAGSNDPRYVGPAALAEFNAVFGLQESSIPLENAGGEGTADVHWRRSIFGPELMTGYFTDLVMPLSRITVAAMADLGYVVNLAAADLYIPGEVAAGGYSFSLLTPWGTEAGGHYRVPGMHLIALAANEVRTGVDFSAFPTALHGSPGGDAYYIGLGADGLTVEIWESAAPMGDPLYSIDKRLLPTLSITGYGGDDLLTIDFANGNPIPAGGLSFDAGPAGSHGNRLVLLGSVSADTIEVSAEMATINGSSIAFAGLGRIDLDARGGADTVTVSGDVPVVLTASQDLASLTLLHDAVVTLGGTSRLLLTRGLYLDAGVTLDLAGNDMVVRVDEPARQAMLDLLRSAIASARNDNLWWGHGITSSAARGNPDIGLMLAMNSTGGGMLLASLKGVALEPTDLVIRHTYNGDLDLDGRISAADYFRIDLAYLLASTGTPLVDLDYNGVLDGDDYFLMDRAFLHQGAAMAPAAMGMESAADVPARPAALLQATSSSAFHPFSRIPILPDAGLAAAFKTLETIERPVSPTYTLLHERDGDGIDLRSEPPADC